MFHQKAAIVYHFVLIVQEFPNIDICVQEVLMSCFHHYCSSLVDIVALVMVT